MLNIFNKKVRLVTHDSSFHADDIFATACLQKYFREIENKKTEIIRTRDAEIIKTGDVVFDVGSKYEPENNLFDHHQTGGAGTRGEYDIPYSSFGLVWKHFGEKMTHNKEVQKKVDESFVQQICAEDTASLDFSIKDTDMSAWTFDRVAKLFYPEELENKKECDKAFKKCVKVAEEILDGVIQKAAKKIEDTKIVEELYEKSEDKRIIVLDEFRFWSDALENKEEALYVISPSSDRKTYRIRAIPEPENPIKSKKALPKEWRGKNDTELEKISGLEDVIFTHNSGFLGAAKNLDTAIKMAQISADWSE
jgi:uncharacterized UPF0160 family protein